MSANGAWALAGALLLAALAAAGCGSAERSAPGDGVIGKQGVGAGVGLTPAESRGKKTEEIVHEDAKPRKVIVGTTCHNMFGGFRTLGERCDELGRLVDEMAARAEKQYGRGLDLVVLPEFALNDMKALLAERAVALYGPGVNYFRNKARRLKTYVVIPAIIAEGGLYHNSAVLIDRDGRLMGRYDKVHVCPDEPPAETFEGGLTPGRDYPVFECDFGRLGLQVCFDYSFEEGWRELARRGAELVAWPSQSPSVAITGARAVNNRLYIVSSTWRDNASIIEPIGTMAAQITPPEEILVHEIDLEYRLIGWHGKLRDGAALKEKYGDDVGFHYYPREDTGVFWSNNPEVPIDAMIRWLGVWTYEGYMAAQTERLERLRARWAAEAAAPQADVYDQWKAGREDLEPIVRTVELKVGEERSVELSDGSTARVKLVGLDQTCDDVRGAVRRAEVTVEVNGQRATLVAATYHLPQTVGGVQIDCSVTSGYVKRRGNVWRLEGDARLRLWPGGSPWVAPGTLGYPVGQRWFATDTQMANEPTFVDGVETPGTGQIYYHDGLDFGGSEQQVDILAVADALVLGAGEDMLAGRKEGPRQGRYDRVVLLDRRGWHWSYSHLDSIDPGIRPGVIVRKGQRLGALGKEGAAGGWTHLHLGLSRKMPSGQWASDDGYAFIWQAYSEQHKPQVIAVARPHHLLWTGQTARLDGSLSWSASGKVARYEWTFGDGTTAEGPTVERTYAKAGVHSEILKVTDDRGHVDYDFAVVQVSDREHPDRRAGGIHAAYFPTLGIKPGDAVTFKVRSFDTTCGQEVWDFGDGTPPVAVRSDGNVDAWARCGYAVTEHRFAEAGTYVVAVRHTNEHGYESVAHLDVHVGEK